MTFLNLWGVIFALLCSWLIKAAVLEPFVSACLLLSYFELIEGQEPDTIWESRLSSVSKKFRKLKEKATSWIDPTPEAETIPAESRGNQS